MSKTLLALGLSMLAVGSASARSHRITLWRPTVLAGAELKPGDYKITLTETKFILKGRKVNLECNMTIEKAERKYRRDSVLYLERDGKSYPLEIRLGGTTTNLVLGGAMAVAASSMPR
jgi:hypothetical protein